MNGNTLMQHGQLYEQMAVGWLEDHGIKANRVSTWKAHDVETDTGVRVEVKGSILQDLGNRRHGYQFLLHRKGKGPHAPSDVHLLICLVSEAILGVFVIPSPELANLCYVSIPSRTPANYRGRWKDYFDRVDLLQGPSP